MASTTTTSVEVAAEWPVTLAEAQRCTVQAVLAGQNPHAVFSFLLMTTAGATPVPIEPSAIDDADPSRRLFHFNDLPIAERLIVVWWMLAEDGGAPSLTLTARTR